MHERAYLDERDGYLYVRYETNDYDRPERTKLFWPVRDAGGNHARVDQWTRQFVGKELSWSAVGAGCYYVKDRPAMTPVTVYLLNGGQTQARFVETESIPEPKQRGRRLETRYRSGRWEKYTARGGWTTVF